MKKYALSTILAAFFFGAFLSQLLVSQGAIRPTFNLYINANDNVVEIQPSTEHQKLVLDHSLKTNRGLNKETCEAILSKFLNFIDPSEKKLPRPKIETKTSPSIPYVLPGSENIHIPQSFLFWLKKKYPNKAIILLTFTIIHEYKHFLDNRNINFGNFEPIIPDDTSNETLADYFGLIFTYLSGEEEIKDYYADFIEKLYHSGLAQEDSPLYAQLKIRKDNSSKVSRAAEKIISRFEIANYCTLIKDYDCAISIYTQLETQFPNLLPEVQNNMAVTYMLYGIDRENRAEQYIYPFEIDDQSALINYVPPIKNVVDTFVSYQLSKATEILQNLKENYPDYEPAKLNWLCLLALRGKTNEAIEYYNKLDVSLRSNQAFKLGLAIALLKIDNNTGKTILNDLSKEDNTIGHFARLNISINNKEKIEFETVNNSCTNIFSSWNKMSLNWHDKIDANTNINAGKTIENYKYISIERKNNPSISFIFERITPTIPNLHNKFQPTFYTTTGKMVHQPTECAIYDQEGNHYKKVIYKILNH